MCFAAIRAVLFDAGNTLVHLDYPFLADVLAAHGHARTPLAIREAEYAAKAAVDDAFAAAAAASPDGFAGPDAGRQVVYFETVLAALGVPAPARVALIAEFRTHHLEQCLWRVLEPDAVPTLDALRARGFRLGVVSNADGRIEADLARLGVRDRFVTVVDSHVVGVEKPDPAVFRLALDAMGVPADATLYVGDLYAIDVRGARRAGLEAVLLDPLDRYPRAVDCERITRLGALLDLLPAATS